MTNITQNLQAIETKMQALGLSENALKNIKLLAVSKAQSAEVIRQAYQAGIDRMGENYLQEALEKQQQLTDLALEWHFIGPIQSNKTQAIAQHFAWVQSVDRIKIAQRLNDARPATMPALQICIQVNISGEASKSGAEESQLSAIAEAVSTLPRLKLRGLMAIPAPTNDNALQHQQFKQVKQCYDRLIAQGYDLDTLSMGMTDDYLAAIAEGATLIRIGSGLFGARKYPTK